MVYRDNPQDKLRLAAISFGDCMLISVALAASVGIFFVIFHFIAWLVGWPGPFLWFGSTSRLADIISATASVTIAAFFLNLFGVVTFLGWAALFRGLRQRS